MTGRSWILRESVKQTGIAISSSPPAELQKPTLHLRNKFVCQSWNSSKDNSPGIGKLKERKREEKRDESSDSISQLRFLKDKLYTYTLTWRCININRSRLLIKIEIRIFIIVLLLTDLIASFSLRIAPQFPLGWNLFAVKNFRIFKTNFQNPVWGLPWWRSG